MNFLLAKSDFNIAAAKMLIQQNYFAPSVHCSYYSCLQLMTYYLYNKLGKNEKTMEAEQRVSTEGKHEYLINLFTREIRPKSWESSRTFNNDIIQLKKLRVDSDYKDIQITITQGNDSFSIAKKIITLLKHNFAA
jgi:hypothetical protein